MFILLFLTGTMAVAFRMIFVRRKNYSLVSDPPEIAELHRNLSDKVRALPHEKLTLTSGDGLKLHARYFPAERETDKTVVLSHGYRGEGLHDHAHNVLYYRSRGYNVLLPDHRSHGDSEGRYISFGALESGDLTDWCKLLVNEYGTKKIMLHGISMGAATVIMASCGKIPELKGTVADCSYTSGQEIFTYVTKNMLKIPKILKTPGVIMLTPVIHASRFICRADILKESPIEAVKNASVPFLFIHGAEDHFVPTEMGIRLYKACTQKKRMLLFDGAGHADSVRMAPKRYYSEIDKFMTEVGM